MTPEEKASLESEAAAIEGEYLQAGEGVSPEKPKISTADALTLILRKTFHIMAPAWDVTDDECALLGESYGAVVDKYWPNGVGVEIGAVLATAIVFGDG